VSLGYLQLQLQVEKKIEVTATVLAPFSLDRAQKNDEHDIFIFSTTSIKEFMYF